jgi:SAM-dependent methyltransferase
LGLFLNAATPAPSAWLQRFVPLIPATGTVLDVACGSGRHLRYLVDQGFKVTGVDRDDAAIAPLRQIADKAEVVVADIEAAPWPLPGRRFDAVVVTNYLWRPLWPTLLAALNEGGIFMAETFADGQQHIGRPSRPEFLLQTGELLRLCVGLRVVAFEDGFEPGFKGTSPRFVQRIVAVAPPLACLAAAMSPPVTPARYAL